MTPEEELELIEIELELRRRTGLSRELSHTPSEPMAAIPPEIPPPNVSDERLSPWQAFQVGRARGNKKEIQNELGGQITEDLRGNRYWTPEGQEQAIPVNPAGFDWGDLPRTLGESLPIDVPAAALAATGATPLGMITKAGLGAFLGSLANEGVQTLEGTQEQSLSDVGRQAAGDAALESGIAGAGAAAGKLWPGAAPTGGSAFAREDLLNAVRFQQENPQFPPLQFSDVSSVTGYGPVPGPVMSRFESQATAMTGRMRDAAEDRAVAANQGLRDLFEVPPTGEQAADVAMGRAARQANERVRGTIKAAGPGSEGGVGREAMFGGLGNTADLVSWQYEGPLKKAIADEVPRFDVTPATREWGLPKLTRQELVDSGLVDANGNPILDKIQASVDAIPSPGGKLDRYKQVLSSVDPEQVNFDALKQIRTDVNTLLEDPGFATQAGRPARQFRDQLDQIIRNPTNKANTPEYLKELDTAEFLAKWKGQRLRDDQVKSFLRSGRGGDFIRSVASDPEGFFNPDVREMLSMADPKQLSGLRAAVRQRMLTSKNPLADIDAANPASSPQAYDFLFDNPAQRSAFEDQAATISRWWGGPMGQTYTRQQKQEETMKFALGQIKSAKQADDLFAQLDPGATEMAQKAVIDDLVFSSVGETAKGVPKLSPTSLAKGIKTLKSRGLWEKLSPDQRRRVEGAQSYYRTSLSRLGDVGTSLETASVVAGLKNLVSPTHFREGIGAVQSLMHNLLLSKYLMSPKRAEKIVAQIGKAPRDLKPWVVSTLLAAPMAGTAFEETDWKAVGNSTLEAGKAVGNAAVDQVREWAAP